MTDSGPKCAWLIHESKAVQVHVHINQCCLSVPWVPGSVKNLGPVVQSVVSLTSSLRVISLTILADSIYNILIFFAEKM